MQSRYLLKAIGSNEIHCINQAVLIMGRSCQCEISIDSGLLSRHHASVSLVDEETIVLKDLDSTNGTFINSMRVLFPTILKHRDVITVGDDKFVFIDAEQMENQSVVAYNLEKSINDFGDEQGSNNTVMQFKYTEDPIASIIKPKSIAPQSHKDIAMLVKKALAEKPLDANLSPAVFVLLSGLKAGSLLELKLAFGVERQWTIGRGELCDIVIEDKTVSSLHAHLSWTNGQWVIVDNRSTNGMRINGKKVNQASLSSGDQVALGKITMVFRVL